VVGFSERKVNLRGFINLAEYYEQLRDHQLVKMDSTLGHSYTDSNWLSERNGVCIKRSMEWARQEFRIVMYKG
jgi:hypothetical protein